jgi:CubicO group peptidase (beta-lactamase class C family)
MDKFKRLDPLIKSFIEKGPSGAACLVTRRGETLYQACFGYADLDTKMPIALDTIYRIYSMSKLITCTAALMLFERGLYLLGDPLEKYLPEFANPQVYRYNENGELFTSPAASSIKIKDLFTMSSGISYGGSQTETERHISKMMQEQKQKEAAGGKKYDNRMVAKVLAEVPLAFDPGTHWKYGLNHDILGALIEVLSGHTFGQFLKDEIFDPLGMNDTFFRIPDEKKNRLCSLYSCSEDGTLTKNTALDADYQLDGVFESGGGGLLSTLADYDRFAQMLAHGGELSGVRILSPNTIRLMSSNHLGPQQLADFHKSPHHEGYGYGLGARVHIDPPAAGSNSNLGEYGWSGMAGTFVFIDPKEELSVVFMQQMWPNFESNYQARIRSVVYGAL